MPHRSYVGMYVLIIVPICCFMIATDHPDFLVDLSRLRHQNSTLYNGIFVVLSSLVAIAAQITQTVRLLDTIARWCLYLCLPRQRYTRLRRGKGKQIWFLFHCNISLTSRHCLQHDRQGEFQHASGLDNSITYTVSCYQYGIMSVYTMFVYDAVTTIDDEVTVTVLGLDALDSHPDALHFPCIKDRFYMETEAYSRWDFPSCSWCRKLLMLNLKLHFFSFWFASLFYLSTQRIRYS